MSDANTIKLTMTGKLSYDDDITVAQGAQIITFLISGELSDSPSGPAVGTDEDIVPPVREHRRAASNPRDALESSGARTNPEKIVAFALYVGQQGEKDTFTVEDIRPLFRQTRETAPKNLSRDLADAVRFNWIAESDEKGEYYVTDMAANVLVSGFDAVRAGRGGGARTRSAGTRTRSGSSRRVRKTPIAIPEGFKDVDVTPALGGYINYHKVTSMKDKYLWAINAAKLWGVDALTNTEIVWLTDKLGEGIPSAHLSAYYKRNQKSGYVNRNAENKVRITPDGAEYVSNLLDGADA